MKIVPERLDHLSAPPRAPAETGNSPCIRQFRTLGQDNMIPRMELRQKRFAPSRRRPFLSQCVDILGIASCTSCQMLFLGSRSVPFDRNGRRNVHAPGALAPFVHAGHSQ